jgi:hypothetical protein
MSTKVSVTKKNSTPVHRVAVTQRSVPTASATVKATPVAKPVVVKATESVVETPVVLEPVTPSGKVHVDAKKKKRQRPRLRPFAEVYAQISEDINLAYKHLQTASRALKSLESAHNREVHNTKSRTNTTRTPTIVFDQALVDYFQARLGAAELTVTRKQGEEEIVVDLSDLSTETRVHRTDVTQLYNRVFKKYDMRNAEDRRNILYQNDAELVALLTEGAAEVKPELADEVSQILAGTYKLTIFNIQRFTSHHLGKVTMLAKVDEADNDNDHEDEDEDENEEPALA